MIGERFKCAAILICCITYVFLKACDDGVVTLLPQEDGQRPPCDE